MATFDLTKFRGNRSTVFTGRPQGMDARQELGLDKLDKNEEPIVLLIPAGTTSFNPSFYLGLLYDSIKRLGFERFLTKYRIEILDENEQTREVIKKNLDDGLRNALNTIQGNYGFGHLLKATK